jgi:DNA-binding protein H-NS
MNRQELKELTLDDLWSLRSEVLGILEKKFKQKTSLLEQRLRRLRAPERRPYPPVKPKYCNSEQPSETWSGRGKKPRWLVEQLKMGRLVEDFRI